MNFGLKKISYKQIHFFLSPSTTCIGSLLIKFVGIPLEENPRKRRNLVTVEQIVEKKTWFVKGSST